MSVLDKVIAAILPFEDEQARVLEQLDPQCEDYRDSLEHTEGAVFPHCCSEEGTWFMDQAQSVPPAEQAMMQAPSIEKYGRHMGRTQF